MRAFVYTLGGRETKVNGDFIQSRTIWRRRDATKVRGNEITVNNVRGVRAKKRESEREHRREIEGRERRKARGQCAHGPGNFARNWRESLAEYSFGSHFRVASFRRLFGIAFWSALPAPPPVSNDPASPYARKAPTFFRLSPSVSERAGLQVSGAVLCGSLSLRLSLPLSPSLSLARLAVRPLLFRVVSEARATEHKEIEKDVTIR